MLTCTDNKKQEIASLKSTCTTWWLIHPCWWCCTHQSSIYNFRTTVDEDLSSLKNESVPEEVCIFALSWFHIKRFSWKSKQIWSNISWCPGAIMAGSHFCKARQGKQSVRGVRVLENVWNIRVFEGTISKMALENFGKSKKPWLGFENVDVL